MTDKELENGIMMLKDFIQKELSYKELCKILKIEEKQGYSKVKQLKDLELICKIKKLEEPTRYVIEEVYDEKLLPMVHKNNKFQLPVEYVIMSFIEKNDYNDIYWTNGELLYQLALVNENYRIVRTAKLRKKLEEKTKKDFYSLYKASNDAGEVLKKWADRILKRMEQRGLILYRKGFCLVEEVIEDGYEYKRKVNVPMQSEIESKVLNCWNKAFEELGLVKYKNDYVPFEFRKMFYKVFDKYIRKEFNGEYIGAYKVNVITPSKEATIRAMTNAKEILNAASCEKIKESNSVQDDLVDKDKLIKEIIKVPAEIKYKDIIRE